MDLALNNLRRLICYKTQQTKPNQQLLTHVHRNRKSKAMQYHNDHVYFRLRSKFYHILLK